MSLYEEHLNRVAELEAENAQLQRALDQVREAVAEITKCFVEAQTECRDSDVLIQRLTRERDEAREIIAAALPILQGFARDNPFHYYHFPEQPKPVKQDPCGVHALLDRIARTQPTPVSGEPK